MRVIYTTNFTLKICLGNYFHVVNHNLRNHSPEILMFFHFEKLIGKYFRQKLIFFLNINLCFCFNGKKSLYLKLL